MAVADKKPSRVPAYQNPQRVVGFCDSLFKPSTMWGKVWLGVGTLLRQGGAGGCEKST